MPTAREIMTSDAECVNADQSVLEAAEKMARLDVGSLPICGTDDRLKGMLTDRDIVVKVLAKGRDPKSCMAGEFAQGEAVTIGADDDAREILRTMASHKVRRLPVIDGHNRMNIRHPQAQTRAASLMTLRASRSNEVRALSVRSPPAIIGHTRMYIPASSDPNRSEAMPTTREPNLALVNQGDTVTQLVHFLPMR